MALVQMKCPNCGGQMQPQGGTISFKCPHCGTTVLNIVEAELDSDVTIMTPEEYEKKANDNKKSLIVKFDDRLEELDINTTVINKKINQASEHLSKGEWDQVFAVFDDKLARSINNKWVNLPSVNRLLLLAYYQVKEESELLLYSVNLKENDYFKKIVNSSRCNQKTKDAYNYIAKECEKNIAIDKRIAEGYKLLQIGEKEKFTIYAKAMCNKYPFKVKSWLLLAEAGNCKKIYKIIKNCPDFYLCQNFVVQESTSKWVSFTIPKKLNKYIYKNDKRGKAKIRAKRFANYGSFYIMLVFGLTGAALMYFLRDNKIFSTYVVWGFLIFFGFVTVFYALAVLGGFSKPTNPDKGKEQYKSDYTRYYSKYYRLETGYSNKLEKKEIQEYIRCIFKAIVYVAVFVLLIFMYKIFCK